MTVQEPVETPITEIELEVRDRNCFFVRLSAETDCLIRLEELIHRADGDLLQYFSIRETPPEDVLDMAASESAIAEARLVRKGPDGNLFQFVVSGPCVTATLADTGAITRDVSAAGGVGRVVATVPAHVAVRTVVETFRARHSEAEFLAKRERDQSPPVRTKSGVHTILADRLTEKQYEVLRTAYLSGYFAWPRESAAQECADALGIAQPTFSQHLRAAQSKVFTALFDAAVDDT
ncbi:bacterio-opsin activator domain-containing protein [Haloplanus rubicundus]|uniref:Bacterio-opsin activator n=1 Tax=Haloplanus rubicundus TaxID=1547898 RepID=A0A345EEF6_9EURY|nr:bacterio-opsin activator domain-containing protein [Haloplanus rubicundus]AXG10578.1 bacterio-opsin activator [Haloplanus rubicundus]